MSRSDNGTQMHDLIGRSGYDNAFAESFFGRFKNEVLQGGVFLDLDDAQTEIFEFIEMDYNRTRIHSGLKYKSPAKFEYYILLTTQLYCPAKANYLRWFCWLVTKNLVLFLPNFTTFV